MPRLLCGQITEFNRNGLDFLTDKAEEAIKGDDLDLGERLAAVLAKERAKRGTWESFDEFLNGVPDVDPEPPDTPGREK